MLHRRRLIAVVYTTRISNNHHSHSDHDEEYDSLKEKAKKFIKKHVSGDNPTHIRAEFEYGKEGKEPPLNAYNPWLNQEGYQKYIEKYGHHFSRKLAIWASSMMENDDGTDNHASPEMVKAWWTKHNHKLPDDATWGDATYAYNMAYADYHPDPLKTEEEVLIQSYKDVNDKDGYSGKIFNRWLSDVIYKNISVPWEDML